MSDLIGNPEDRFCHDEAHILFDKIQSNLFKSGHSKEDKNRFSGLKISKCMSKVLQNSPWDHSTILSTSIKLPAVLSICEWPLKTGLAVFTYRLLYFSFLHG